MWPSIHTQNVCDYRISDCKLSLFKHLAKFRPLTMFFGNDDMLVYIVYCSVYYSLLSYNNFVYKEHIHSLLAPHMSILTVANNNWENICNLLMKITYFRINSCLLPNSKTKLTLLGISNFLCFTTVDFKLSLHTFLYWERHLIISIFESLRNISLFKLGSSTTD